MSALKPVRRRLDIKNGRVDLSHGAGGRAMGQLIEDIFHAAFDNEWLRAGNDQSAFDAPPGRMVMTTDGYVVTPIFFPGGDIGSLAVHGTINDIAMAGAKPIGSSASAPKAPAAAATARRAQPSDKITRCGRERGAARSSPIVACMSSPHESAPECGGFCATRR